eukprot:8052045-Karenia_brevis.AAC.1
MEGHASDDSMESDVSYDTCYFRTSGEVKGSESKPLSAQSKDISSNIEEVKGSESTPLSCNEGNANQVKAPPSKPLSNAYNPWAKLFQLNPVEDVLHGLTNHGVPDREDDIDKLSDLASDTDRTVGP